MKMIFLIILATLPLIGVSQQSKQYKVYEVAQRRGQSVKVMAVNIFDKLDSAVIIYSWRGLGKHGITRGTILTVHTKGIGKRKTFVTLNN